MWLDVVALAVLAVLILAGVLVAVAGVLGLAVQALGYVRRRARSRT